MEHNAQFAEVFDKAMSAYLETWRENHIGEVPTPKGMRDKKWSKFLREVWPDCTVVNLDDSMRSSVGATHNEKHEWCSQQSRSNFWVNHIGNVWYFERKDIAALFKLQFGGECK